MAKQQVNNGQLINDWRTDKDPTFFTENGHDAWSILRVPGLCIYR